MVAQWVWAFPGMACEPAPARPSILLVVLDTVRADAVSAYGSTRETTPRIDALASMGVRYAKAYAPSPWTLPSHATLFTGLGVETHRTGMPGQLVMPSDVPTVASLLSAAGYESAAFAENAIVSDAFALLRGFEYRRFLTFGQSDERGRTDFDAIQEIRAWLAQRDECRPYFVFVNLFGAHAPYEIREANRFLPSDADPAAVKGRASRPHRLLCGGLPGEEEVAIQRGLYLGDVAAVDAKAGEIIDLLRDAGSGDGPIVVVTSDHGELFGEERLMGHDFSLHGALLRVPLIVYGAPGAAPSVVEQGVGLEDVATSVLRWAGVPEPESFTGRPLPLVASQDGERSFFAAYSDAMRHSPRAWLEDGVQLDDLEHVRQFCSETDKVYGGMASLTRYPFKYRWYQRYPPELYDLSWDAGERSNQAEYRPDLVESFAREMDRYLAESGVDRAPEQVEELPEEAVESLRALGYIDP